MERSNSMSNLPPFSVSVEAIAEDIKGLTEIQKLTAESLEAIASSLGSIKKTLEAQGGRIKLLENEVDALKAVLRKRFMTE